MLLKFLNICVCETKDELNSFTVPLNFIEITERRRNKKVLMHIGNDCGVFQTSFVLDVVLSSLAGKTKGCHRIECLTIKYIQTVRTGTRTYL